MEEKKTQNKEGTGAGKRERSWIKTISVTAASAAAVLAVGAGVCYTNPVLASQIPIIGKIFGWVQEDLTFSGQYSGKGITLTQEQETEKEGEKGASDYAVKD